MASQPQASSSFHPTKLFAKLSIVGKAIAKPGRTAKTVRSRFTVPIKRVMRRKGGMDMKIEHEGSEAAQEVEPGRGPSIMDKLPYDVLLAILLHMELLQVQAMSQVCRKVYDATQSPEVWHHLACTLQAETACLVVGDSVNPVFLPLVDLKRVVLRSRYLQLNWDKRPRGQHPLVVRKHSIPLETNVVELLPIASTYVCDNHLILPTENKLVCMDIETKHCVSEYDFQYTRPRLSFAKSYQTGAIYAIIIGNSPDNSEMRLHVVHIRMNASGLLAKVDQSISHNISNTWLLVAMAINADEKTVCLLLYQNQAPKNLKIFVIFYWDARSYIMLDTGLTIEMPSDHMTSLIRYTDDYQFVVICVERNGQWIQESFKISHLKALAFPDIYSALAHPIHTQTSSISDSFDTMYKHTFTPFELPSDTLGQADQFICWSIPPPHYRYPGVPAEYSHIFVYSVRRPQGVESTVQYQVAQHYTSEEGPYEDARLVFPLGHPRIMPYDAQLSFPLMGVSFNHIAWIETTSFAARTYALRLITFSKSTRRAGDERPEVKVLKDVPQKVLRNAHQIFLRPDMAAISITTLDNMLHTFYYG